MGKDVLSYNKLVAKTKKLVQRYNVPKHWSKTKNEKFDVHTVCILFVLFQIEQKDYRLSSGWLSVTTALGLPGVPHWTYFTESIQKIATETYSLSYAIIWTMQRYGCCTRSYLLSIN